MSTLYSIEESLERATVTVLENAAALDDVRIVSADENDEDTLPQITVRAEKLEEVVRGMQTWNCRLTITQVTAADLTPEAYRVVRCVPDTVDDEDFSAGFKSLWKTLCDLADADQFVTDLNAEDIVKVWAVEFDPVTYENETRSFRRSLNIRCWANEAYPTA